MRLLPMPTTSQGRRAVAIPVATLAMVLAGSVVLGGVHADSAFASQHPKLPAKTPLQLLTAVQSSKTEALSGTVTESAHWGLPSLPGSTDTASLGWQTLLTGSHTVRVSIAGPSLQRLAVLGSLSESDVVRNGADLWTYTSTTNTVTHTVLPTERADSKHRPAAAEAAVGNLTPEGAARQLLAAVNPSTGISVDPTQRVAGRSAYTLVLTPRDSRSTVHKVEIALDSKQFIPLRVRLFGAGSTPAFETGFTSISFRTPPASTFRFRPPAGASTSDNPFGLSGSAGGHSDQAGLPQADQVKLLGSGWTSVLEIPASGAATGLLPKASAGSDGSSARQVERSPLASLTTPLGNNGDRLLHTSVVNALLTADGRMLIGAVSPKLLEDAAAGTFK